jgi:hypothetical protein
MLPTQDSKIISNYRNNTVKNNHRPLTSFTTNSNSYINSSFLHDQPEPTRYNSTLIKPYESMREPFGSTRLNALRTGKYVPPFFSRSYFP